MSVGEINNNKTPCREMPCKLKYLKRTCINFFKKPDIIDFFSKSRHFFWINKEWIVGGSACIFIAITVYYQFRLWLDSTKAKEDVVKKPISATVVSTIIELKPTKCEVNLSISPNEVKPQKIGITFCIDTSSSMGKDDRRNQVDKGVCAILDKSLIAVNKMGAKISVAIVGFNRLPYVICEPIDVTDSNIKRIKTSLNKYETTGETDIIAGLEEATKQLNIMKKGKGQISHTLILLTDGKQNIIREQTKNIRDEIIKTGSKSFAIGIGEGHNQETLSNILPMGSTYIDITKDNKTILDELSSIYERATRVFDRVVLTAPQLKHNMWSIEYKTNKKEHDLGSLSLNKNLSVNIQLHQGAFQGISSSTISFVLKFFKGDTCIRKTQVSQKISFHLKHINRPGYFH